MKIETYLLKGLFIASVLAGLLTLGTMLASPAPFGSPVPMAGTSR